MKKIVFSIMLSLSMHVYGAEAYLVKVTDEELNLSKKFLKLERYQQKNLYDYVRLLKARYILTREMVWVSTKIAEAISVQSSMILIQEK